MTDEWVGVSAASSASILEHTLHALELRGAFGALLDPSLAGFARALAHLLPDHLFPDVYLEQPLLGNGLPRAGFVLDAFERNYLHHRTKGTFWERTTVAPATEPSAVDTLCGMASDRTGIRPFVTEDCSVPAHVFRDLAASTDLHEHLGLTPAGASAPSLRQLLLDLAALPLRIFARGEGPLDRLIVVLPRKGMRERFENAPYREPLTQALAKVGVDAARLSALTEICLRCATPCVTSAHGMQHWVSCVDLSHVVLTFRDGRLVGCAAGIRLSDRIVPFLHHAFRPIRFYQWHITDNCDQRCRHCYLFAEDARRHCLSTPLGQLLSTLDEVERRSAELHCVPFLAITGGDPLMHPQFWEFAQELHRRGFGWSMMGNPFHLDEAVCRRLHQLGCLQYQLSLDGRRAFHDGLRKPGSFDATVAAVPLLKDAGIAVQLMATASNQNLSEILACMDLADELDADYFAFARYCATSPQKAAELYPTPQEYRAFLLAYLERRRLLAEAGSRCDFRLKEHLFCLLRYELGEFEVSAYSRAHPNVICDGCHLGAKATIAVNGDLLACPRLDSVVGSIHHGSLGEAEEGAAMRAYRSVDAIEGCSDCKLLMWCRGCRAVGYNATGNLQAGDPMCWHVVPKES